MWRTTMPIVASSNDSHVRTSFVNSIVGYEMSSLLGPREPAEHGMIKHWLGEDV